MPAGVPVATVAIGEAGAKNAGLLAAQILAMNDINLGERLQIFRDEMKQEVNKSFDFEI